jgi:hypothetical protein
MTVKKGIQPFVTKSYSEVEKSIDFESFAFQEKMAELSNKNQDNQSQTTQTQELQIIQDKLDLIQKTLESTQIPTHEKQSVCVEIYYIKGYIQGYLMKK